MKTPTWAIIIGICLLVIGSCSISKNVSNISLPETLAMQEKMLNEFQDSLKTSLSDTLIAKTNSETATSDQEMINFLSEGMQELLTISDFTKTWTVRFGYIGLLVSFLYLLSGVFLLVKKKFSIQLVYYTLIISVLFGIIQAIVLASDTSGGFLSRIAGLGNIFGVAIDIILIIVVISADKSAYPNHSENTEQLDLE